MQPRAEKKTKKGQKPASRGHIRPLVVGTCWRGDPRGGRGPADSPGVKSWRGGRLFPFFCHYSTTKSILYCFFRPLLGFIGRFGDSGCFWPLLVGPGHFGSSLTACCCFCHFKAILSVFGHVWLLWATFGRLPLSLAIVGPLATFGHFSCAADCVWADFGCYWTPLVTFGHVFLLTFAVCLWTDFGGIRAALAALWPILVAVLLGVLATCGHFWPPLAAFFVHCCCAFAHNLAFNMAPTPKLLSTVVHSNTAPLHYCVQFQHGCPLEYNIHSSTASTPYCICPVLHPLQCCIRSYCIHSKTWSTPVLRPFHLPVQFCFHSGLHPL